MFKILLIYVVGLALFYWAWGSIGFFFILVCLTPVILFALMAHAALEGIGPKTTNEFARALVTTRHYKR